MQNWRLEKAPSYSDIKWHKLGTYDVSSLFKSFILYLGLFVICVVLVTPLTLFDVAKPMANWISSDMLGDQAYLSNLLPEYLAPLILVLFNSVIIPKLVDLVAYLQDHETHSGMQLTIMVLNFIFMVLNMVFIPLTNYITVKQFLTFVIEAV